MLTVEEMLTRSTVEEVAYGWRDAVLYALSIGAGRDPLDHAALLLTTEAQLQAVPTMATVLGSGISPLADCGLRKGLMVHGAQSLEMLRPLPAGGRVRIQTDVTGVQDKGAEKGAVVRLEKRVADLSDGGTIAILHSNVIARGDGGFGGPDIPLSTLHPMPNRKADVEHSVETRPDQALLYRLNGDLNPIHSDPDMARKAGFERPILHGLCTFGITALAVIQVFCEGRPECLTGHAVRFSTPVLPGDIVTMRMWRDGDVISFEASVAARGVTVIRNGRARISV